MGCETNCAQCRQFPCTCSTNYWILSSGTNTLKGCECDPDNPIVLQDCFILDALEHSQLARTDFCKLYPALWPCEKERFDLLFRDNPGLVFLVKDCTTSEDTFQARMNRIPVYTAGRLGGRFLPAGRVAQSINLPPHLAPKMQPRKC
jgi:hypothetical protein